MGLLRRLRDRFGPAIGIGESRETRAEKTVRKYLDAAKEARTALRDVDILARRYAKDTMTELDRIQSNNFGRWGADNDLKAAVTPIKGYDRLKSGELTRRHGDNAELATEEAQQRIAFAEEQIRLNEKIVEYSDAVLDHAGVSIGQAFRRDGKTPASQLSERMASQREMIMEAVNQEINGGDLASLKKEAEGVLAGHDLAKRMFAEAEDQHQLCMGFAERQVDEFDGRAGLLDHAHENILIARYATASSRDAALTEISEWKKQIGLIKQSMSAEFGIAELPDPMQVYEATPEGPEGWPKDMPGAEKEESVESLYPELPDGFEGLPKELPSM